MGAQFAGSLILNDILFLFLYFFFSFENHFLLKPLLLCQPCTGTGFDLEFQMGQVTVKALCLASHSVGDYKGWWGTVYGVPFSSKGRPWWLRW